MLNLGFNLKLGSKTRPYPTTGVPSVNNSNITDSQSDGILVAWDRPMTMTCDAKDQINVIIDGGAPLHPINILFHPDDKRKMGLIMAIPFTHGQVVTWAYDDTGGCDLQQIEAPNTEADNQTYSVSNDLSISASDSFYQFKIKSAVVDDTATDAIKIVFDGNIISADVSLLMAFFTIEYTTAIVITGLNITDDTLTITMDTNIPPSESIKVTYDGNGDLHGDNGVPIGSFSHVVDDNVTTIVLAPTSVKITLAHPSWIQVTFAETVYGVHADVIAATTITVDGGTPFHPSSMDFMGNIMSFVMPNSVAVGQVVVATYDGTADLKGVVGHIVGAGTMTVDNQLVASAPKITSTIYSVTNPSLLYLAFDLPVEGNAEGISIETDGATPKVITSTAVGFSPDGKTCGVSFSPDYDGVEILTFSYDPTVIGGFTDKTSHLEADAVTAGHIVIAPY